MVHLKSFEGDNLFSGLYICIDTMCSLEREKKDYLKRDVKDLLRLIMLKKGPFELH